MHPADSYAVCAICGLRKEYWRCPEDAYRTVLGLVYQFPQVCSQSCQDWGDMLQGVWMQNWMQDCIRDLNVQVFLEEDSESDEGLLGEHEVFTLRFNLDTMQWEPRENIPEIQEGGENIQPEVAG